MSEIANTPDPPYYAVIFASLRSDVDDDGLYEATPPECDHCVDGDGNRVLGQDLLGWDIKGDCPKINL